MGQDATRNPQPAHFIPIRMAELTAALARRPELAADQRELVERFSFLVGERFHAEFHQLAQNLKHAYAPFDPDADTVPVFNSQETEQERYVHLFESFAAVLGRANFRRLTPLEIQAALEARSEWGLNLDVDFRAFDRLEIYARGEQIGSRWRRRWRNLHRWEEVRVPIYQRLVVIFRLREDYRYRMDLDTHDVFIKLFKDIPTADLEMLLPAGRVRMTLFDQTKIALPTASGLAIAIWKMFTGAVAVAAAGFYGALAILGLVGGTVGYGIRSFFGYLQTKQRYQLSLTESLYFQNLDNNAGVFFRLLSEAEEQECCEVLLAYYFVWRSGAAGVPAAELDATVERYLARLVDHAVDFELHDALHKLQRWRLATIDAAGRVHGVPIAAAVDLLTHPGDFAAAAQGDKARGCLVPAEETPGCGAVASAGAADRAGAVASAGVADGAGATGGAAVGSAASSVGSVAWPSAESGQAGVLPPKVE